MLLAFPNIQASRVARVALWLLGEYCEDAEGVAASFTMLKECLGELPFIQPAGEGGEAAAAAPQARAEGRPVVLADRHVESARLGGGTARHHGLLGGWLPLPGCSPHSGGGTEPCSSL